MQSHDTLRARDGEPGPPVGLSARYGYLVASVAILGLDQATKLLALRHLRGRAAIEVVPGFFSLFYSSNRGGLFGLFREWDDPWRGLLLTLVPAAAVVLIASFLVRSRDADRLTLAGLAAILGGATGNLIDRLLRGEVVDFLDVYAPPSGVADQLVRWFGTAHWPTFNVADSAIVVGAAFLLWRIAFPLPATAAVRPPAGARRDEPA